MPATSPRPRRGGLLVRFLAPADLGRHGRDRSGRSIAVAAVAIVVIVSAPGRDQPGREHHGQQRCKSLPVHLRSLGWTTLRAPDTPAMSERHRGRPRSVRGGQPARLRSARWTSTPTTSSWSSSERVRPRRPAPSRGRRRSGSGSATGSGRSTPTIASRSTKRGRSATLSFSTPTSAARGARAGPRCASEAGYLYEVRDGKIARVEIFETREDALEAASHAGLNSAPQVD